MENKLILNKYFKNKKGISAIVSTVILLLLVVAGITIVWVVVTNLVTEELGSSQSCIDVLDKVKINNDYLCYNSTLGREHLQLSLLIKDIELDGLLVGISFDGGYKTFTMNSTAQQIPNVVNYTDNGTYIKIPEKNSGKSYRIFGIYKKPNSVEIVPIIGTDQCDIGEKIYAIDDCNALVV